jgi:hypothetical protein
MTLPLLVLVASAAASGTPAAGTPAAGSPAAGAPAAAAPPVTVAPIGWVRPSFTYIQDDPAAVTDQDGFGLSARIGATARFRDYVSARAEVELSPSPSLKDAVLTVKPARFLRLDVGQFKIPVSASYQASDTRRLLPTDPRVVSELASRDLGAALTLSLPIDGRNVASVQSGVFNGEGPNLLQNVNQRFEYVERLLVTPFGARDIAFEGTDRKLYLGVGGCYVYNYTGDGETVVESNSFGGELQGAWRFLSVQGEVLTGSDVHANASVEDKTWLGWYGQVGSFVPVGWAKDHVEVVVRVGEDDPSTATVGEATGPELPHSREIAGGVNLYASFADVPLHDVKLQLAYAHQDELEGTAIANDTFTVSAVARY